MGVTPRVNLGTFHKLSRGEGVALHGLAIGLTSSDVVMLVKGPLFFCMSETRVHDHKNRAALYRCSHASLFTHSELLVFHLDVS